MSPNPITAKTIFLSAPDIVDEAERRAFVAEQCGDDEALRRDVERLLHHDAAQGSFLEPPAVAATATADSVSKTESPGAVIGSYKLLEQIGEGGFGVVFMAEQTRPVQRKVAPKIIKPGMDSKQVVARFEAERQALAMMDHVNIARVFDGGATEAGRPYFVMELVHGVPITKYCDDNHLTPRGRLELFVPVCHAIQHAHQKGIIHRDVKPSNVMVTLYDGKPVPKVIDFGVAKATEQKLTERTLFTNYGAMVGTLEYMSPEQAELSALGVDTRSDIYSLGVLLYELLTGSTPLSRKRVKEAALAEILRIIKEEEPPRPSARLSDSGDALASISANRHMEPARLTRLLRGELDWIVMKCLEKDRTRRYETANGFAMDVLRYLADEPVLACPPSANYRLGKFVRRNRGAVLAVSTIFLLLVGGIIGTTVGLVHAREERAIAQAVNDFVQKDLLGQADPANQPGGPGADSPRDPDIKVRTLLDRAAKSIGNRFANQPRVEAAIRLTIAKAYFGLGDPVEAQHHGERSVELRTIHLGPDHPDTLTSKEALYHVYDAQALFDRAEAIGREVLEKRTAMLGPNHPDTLNSEANLAHCYWMQVSRDPSKIDQARTSLEVLIEKRASVLGPEHPDTLESRSNLAWIYKMSREFDKAASIFNELLTIHESRFGSDYLNTIIIRSNLGLTYLTQGKLDQAEPLLVEVLKRRIALHGEDHIWTSASKMFLGQLYHAQGKLTLAVPLFEQAFEQQKAKVGCNAQTIMVLECPVFALFDSKQLEKAKIRLQELVDCQRKIMGAETKALGAYLGRIGFHFLQISQFTEAEPLLRESWAIRRKTAPDDWMTFAAESDIGASLMGQKKYADAEPLLLRGFQGMKERRDKMSPRSIYRFINALQRIVRLYESWTKPGEAAKWRKELEPLTKAAKMLEPAKRH